MKCPNCNAEVTGKFCEYCGSEMPKEQIQQNITVINNYYNNDTEYEEMGSEDIIDKVMKDELLPESKLGIISLILSVLSFLISFSSFGISILLFIPTLICGSVSLLKNNRKRTLTKISFGIFILSIALNVL